ncbi:alpha/beta fold hydrolase [Thermodesulfobacteriota bacterium]
MDIAEYSIVLLPGLDGTGKLFTPLVDSFPKRITPIVISYPCHQRKTYEELKEIVMLSLPHDLPFFILGESFSGPLSVMIANERPEGLMGLILCATFIKNPFVPFTSWMKIFSVGPIYRLWPALIDLRARIGGRDFRGIADLALEAIELVNPDVIAHRVKSILSVNVENELRSCPYPVLYLMAGRDKLVRKHNFKKIKSVNEDIELAIIDTLHFVLQLEPQKASEILVEYMDKIMKEKGEIIAI